MIDALWYSLRNRGHLVSRFLELFLSFVLSTKVERRTLKRCGDITGIPLAENSQVFRLKGDVLSCREVSASGF